MRIQETYESQSTTGRQSCVHRAGMSQLGNDRFPALEISTELKVSPCASLVRNRRSDSRRAGFHVFNYKVQENLSQGAFFAYNKEANIFVNQVQRFHKQHLNRQYTFETSSSRNISKEI